MNESTAELQAGLPTGSQMQRDRELRSWLVAVLGHQHWSLTPASADASFRRYFRVHLEAERHAGQTSLIVMDAPPDREDCRPFVHVAALLADAQVHVPQVFAQHQDKGFLLLSDLGDQTYLSALESGSDADILYRDAISALLRMQQATRHGELAPYDHALLSRELQLFPDWYVERQLGVVLDTTQRELLEESFRLLLASNLSQGQVYVHRDYHSRNLMVTAPNPGVLDFQDAVLGPITYDLVSLLRDAYIAWPEESVIDWCVRYWDGARKLALPVPADFAQFYRDFEWMGAQRQLKVLGIFARLCHRDGKSAYLNDQPRVRSYLQKTAQRYGELAPLAKLLDRLAPLESAGSAPPELGRSGFTF